MLLIKRPLVFESSAMSLLHGSRGSRKFYFEKCNFPPKAQRVSFLRVLPTRSFCSSISSFSLSHSLPFCPSFRSSALTPPLSVLPPQIKSINLITESWIESQWYTRIVFRTLTKYNILIEKAIYCTLTN